MPSDDEFSSDVPSKWVAWVEPPSPVQPQTKQFAMHIRNAECVSVHVDREKQTVRIARSHDGVVWFTDEFSTRSD